VLEQILRHHTRRGGTVIFSDHAMDVVERLCDHLLLIDRGTVVLSGTTAGITGGRRLQDVFVETVGAHITEEGDLDWLGSS
jgi:ABC-2 type transport system ATP-binding protein